VDLVQLEVLTLKHNRLSPNLPWDAMTGPLKKIRLGMTGRTAGLIHIFFCSFAFPPFGLDLDLVLVFFFFGLDLVSFLFPFRPHAQT
jgi:hypothetical protein